ncbi:MAG: LamG domain-containing protein, partial [Candidatus Paceibacterota bacterium]
ASNKDRTLAINASDKAILYVYGTNAIGTTSITNNAWHYLAGTSDGTTTKIYVDGVSENSAVPTFSTYTYNGARIGKNNAVAAYFFNGTIDDVRVFDVAMPTSQIQQDYFAGLNKLFAKNQITQTDYQQRLAELSNNYVKE